MSMAFTQILGAQIMSFGRGGRTMSLDGAMSDWLVRPTFLVLLALTFEFAAGGSATAQKLVETQSLAALVEQGKLPPVEQRVPAEADVALMREPGQAIGRPGGVLTQIMGRPTDIKKMAAFGYARLVKYNRQYQLVPGLLRAIEVKDRRVFTLSLRKGHRWSDGAPFTTEDFRYWWEDVALNPELSPGGPPQEMLIDGEPPIVDVIDEVTIRYTWQKPNPYFLPALAAATPLYIYRPSHYLKRFHIRYADPEKLAEELKKRKQRSWNDLHANRDRIYRFDSPEMPTLEPWILTTPPPSDRFVFERNPYYYRIDMQGRQLPYIDQVAIVIAAPKLIPAKVGAGEVELQSRGVQFNNYTLLKQDEQRGNYDVRLWRSGSGSQLALYPNFNAKDAQWRALIRDVRFRRALSSAIDRHEINQVIYFGLAREGNNTVLPESPLYRPEYQTLWADFKLKRANALLDELSLTKRDARGIRLMPDGRPLEIIVETASEEYEQSDVLELIRDSWVKAGIALFIKPTTREVLRKRVTAGSTVMMAFNGLDNGIATVDIPPSELAPTVEDQFQWSQWGLYYVSGGKTGQAPDLPAAQKLMQEYRAWSMAESDADKAAAWHALLQISADEVITIGTVNAVPQPVVISHRLRNVPETALYAWEPGAHFGIYETDTFWFSDAKEGS
jgi:peptide/nickel transport system substrate-binding protein